MAASNSNSHFPPCKSYCLAGLLTVKQIVFTAGLHGTRWKNYLISADGGAPQPVLSGEQTSEEEDPNLVNGWQLDRHSFPAGTINIVDFEPTKFRRARIKGTLLTSLVARRPLHCGAIVQSSGLMLFDFKNQKWTELANIDCFPQLVTRRELPLFSLFRK